MAKKKNYEIIKEKTSNKGRPKEHKLKVRQDVSETGKITYKFEKSMYPGIYGKYVYVDGVKSNKGKPVAYKVVLEKGYKKVRDENGKIKDKRIRETRIVENLADAKLLKAKEKDEEEKNNKNVTVHDAWEDFKNTLLRRDTEDFKNKYKIVDYKVAQNHMELYFGKEREISSITVSDYENFFWDLSKGIKGNNKRNKKNEDGKTEEEILICGKNTCGKYKCSILQLYKFMDKDYEKYKTKIETIQKVSVKDIHKSEREKNFEPIVLTPKQINQLLEYAVLECSERDAGNLTLLCFGVLAGLRKGEILGLRWECIEDSLEVGAKIRVKYNRRTIDNEEVIKKPKTGKERYAADVNEAISMCLKIIEHTNKGLRYPEYMNNDEMLSKVELDKNDSIYITYASSMRADGKLPPPKSCWRRFQEFIKRCNKWLVKKGEEEIPLMRIHDLRTTFSTINITSNEVNWLQVSWAMGHNIKLTGLSNTPTTFTNYLKDDGNRDSISEYWNSIIDVAPMKAYMDEHGIK